MAFFFTKVVRNIILLLLVLNGIQMFLKWKSYNIQAKDFKAFSVKSADANSINSVSKFVAELRRKYSHDIDASPKWIPFSAGGLHLKAQFLYGDLTEYIAVFTAIGDSTGRSGIHWSNHSCTVLTGEVTRVPDSFSSPVKESYKQGQNFRHGQFESFVYILKDQTTVACYGRGFIPASSVWSLSGSLATGDPFAGLKQLYVYGKLTVDSLTRHGYHYFDYISKKAKGEL
ncbi:unnamed protein product [Bursaphelenchus xylophilus]|uniref:Sigma non-opioid intracellular receptor 1 n=1 Tax=Bursaphelenchus xylophilus TaxID=6326 RepID=A0A1I7SWN5_BURXY|nr:unnamed protein product [Bursaphelenchus xylophilus]CAG9099716.1 unnamed protein product [Bursaphelenchus xylophilus]